MASEKPLSGPALFRRLEEPAAQAADSYHRTAQPLSGSIMIVLHSTLLACGIGAIHDLTHACQEFSQEVFDYLKVWEEERQKSNPQNGPLPSDKVM